MPEKFCPFLSQVPIKPEAPPGTLATAKGEPVGVRWRFMIVPVPCQLEDCLAYNATAKRCRMMAR